MDGDHEASQHVSMNRACEASQHVSMDGDHEAPALVEELLAGWLLGEARAIFLQRCSCWYITKVRWMAPPKSRQVVAFLFKKERRHKEGRE